MSFSPGVNMVAVEPMLFGGPVCVKCGTELPPSKGSGRPKKYCSKACSKKAERDREAEKIQQLKADLRAAESPREETGPLDGPVDDPVAAELLGLGEELARADRRLLLQLDRAARDGDPALARQALTDVLHSAHFVTQRHHELVEQLRTEHSAFLPEAKQPATGPHQSPRGETATALGPAPKTIGAAPAAAVVPPPATTDPQTPSGPTNGSPRDETTTRQVTPGSDLPTQVAPRGETTPTPETTTPAPAAPRGENPLTSSTSRRVPARPTPTATVPHPDDTELQPDAVLRATADPVRRFGPPDRTDDLTYSFGPGWTATSWSAPETAGIRQLHQHGVRAGWAAPLRQGPRGGGGWIAVLLLADGRTEPILDDTGRAHTFRDQGPALEAVRGGRTTPPVTAARTPDADRPAPRTEGWIGPRMPEPGTVAVPRDPLRRGLPRSRDVHIPLDPATFGYNWVLSGWTVQPDVMVVLGEGYPVGWVERGLDGSSGWVAVHEGYFLGDPATQQAAVHDTPELAARIVHHAHVQDL
ncbi:hypothetical protein ACFVXH_39515 [Kitasatospora sp. NPDC058184]|uniref:hypothetical protein n=1 Tax=Kitasatospora sp. NPDC058184 TaxID=3346370 RepID=UPI0036DF13BF